MKRILKWFAKHQKQTDSKLYELINSVHRKTIMQSNGLRKCTAVAELKRLSILLMPFYDDVMEKDLLLQKEILKTIDAALAKGVHVTEPALLELFKLVTDKLEAYYLHQIQQY